MYGVTKRFGHERGLSCAFRQHAATHSHCQFLHGYALAFTFHFTASTLDARNWVVDFGEFSRLWLALQDMFDHKVVIATDDPYRDKLMKLANETGTMDVRVLDRVGCESFARYAASMAVAVLGLPPGVRLEWVECAEHAANSATYYPGGPLPPSPVYPG